MSDSSIRTVNGLSILDVPIGCGMSFHSFYLKEHHENKAQLNISKTLFVGNVDFKENASLEEISNLLTDIFGVFGSVESISVSDFTNQDANKNSRFAHVCFKNRSSLKSILSNSSHSIFSDIKKNIAMKYMPQKQLSSKFTSSQYYYDYDDSSKLADEASTYIQNYEENEMLETIKRNQELKVDEDGFTQVTYRYAFVLFIYL